MKRLFLLILFSFNYSTFSVENWSNKALQNVEFNNIKNNCLKIISQHGSPFKSSASGAAVYNYLINIGTPTSLEVLKFLVNNGIMPRSYLNNI